MGDIGLRVARALLVALPTLAVACSAQAFAAPRSVGVAAPPITLHVGTQTVTRCGASPLSYCGRLSVPLDYRLLAGARISIAYRWYPASAPPGSGESGTVVPVEGGPGYPSIGSVAGGYSVMYGSLLERWNMLAVDNRGTGQSTPLSCPALQGFSGATASEAFQQAAAGCARTLNHRWRNPDGSWAHASDLFTTAPATRDLAAVIGALQLPKVDLYGDSYGSFFAQAFAARFPRLVRSLILDSTYQTAGLDPWYRSTVNAMPAGFNAACSRSPACAQAATGSSWERIGALAQRLREQPIAGMVPGPAGTMQHVSMDVVGLVDLLNDAAGDPRIYRELDASARALLDGGDPAPLLRLYAQRLAEDESYFGAKPGGYSAELYLAVSCLDYPQLFDLRASPSLRATELIGAESGLAPSTFAPFSTAEWLAQDQNTEAYSACLDWPAPVEAEPPTTGTTPLLASSLPVLVLGGELDTWTPPSEVHAVLAQLGGHSRFVKLANATHVVGEGDTACGSELVRAFVARPQAIDSLDASCALAVAPIHTVGVYATRLSEQPPIEASPGSDASAQALRLAAAAISTAGDAIARYEAIQAPLDHGLLGGTVTATREGRLLTLNRDQLVPAVAVSGAVALTPSPIPSDGDMVVSTLKATAPGIPAASFTAIWTTSGANAVAQVTGSVGAEPVSGTMPAP
jgi:pimeloyl-ACP methyl ester carboxylesterase